VTRQGGFLISLLVVVSHSGQTGAPLRSLAGFRRVHLEPGETQKVDVSIPNRNLSFVDEKGVRRIAAGTLDVWVGGGQPVGREGLPKTAGLSGSVKITGAAVLPKYYHCAGGGRPAP